MHARKVVVMGAERSAPDWGAPLNEADYEKLLKESWITRELADQAMLCRVSSEEGQQIVGRKGRIDCSGILIPYYWPGETQPHTYRLRRDKPDLRRDKNGELKPDKKYLAPPGDRNRLYIPPGVTLEQLSDPAIPVVIVEGEKKALALQRLAYYESEKPRFIPVAIPGVWNWRGVTGKATSPEGERVEVKGPIPDLDRVVWPERKVIILFDANVHTNDSVKWARRGLARELASRRAKAEFVNLPPDCGVNGVDDLLVAWGPEQVLALFSKATAGAAVQVVQPPQFVPRPEGMFRVTRKGEQLIETQMTNFRASIIVNNRLDDGVEVKREFEVEAELLGRAFEFSVPAARFPNMDWAVEQMGSHAIVYPHQKDYARTAIQALSLLAPERRIFTYTGFRREGGRWIYLHAGGAIGPEGAVPDVNVRLPGALGRFELALPSSPESLIVSIHSVLRLLDLCPPAVAFPLVASVFRAPLSEADFALHITGETGCFKSEVAALMQQHYGAAMTRTNLPCAWSSTGNSLEVTAFHAKDALAVVDDFAPQGSHADIARLHAAADRLFRAAGNGAGRSRLDSTARLREAKPPRALLLSTGEDIPHGHSLRARLLILELAKGEVDQARLTECQTAAISGEYARVMGDYVSYIAGRFDTVRETLRQRVAELRGDALRDPAHARTPGIIANLQAAFELFTEYCEQRGAIDASERERLTHDCWRALRRAGAAQENHHAAAEPAAQFVSLLRSCLTSGQAHLASRAGGAPTSLSEVCGWRKQGLDLVPLGRCVGWTESDDIYIEPAAAYQVVQIAARDSGEPLNASRQTLKKRLREKGLLASVDESRGTLTVRRTICGSSKDVLHMLRAALLPPDPEQSEESEAA